jgi:hypothetical protein
VPVISAFELQTAPENVIPRRKRVNRKRIVLRHTILLDGKPEVVFPLLCPVREYEWIEPWKCDLIYSETGFAEQDCIFQTDFSHDGPKDTWVLCRHDKPTLVEFVRVNAIRAIRYTITLRQVGEGKTESEWTQVITGLNNEGDRLVSSLSGEEFRNRMEMLRKMMNHYLASGRMLKSTGEEVGH